MSHSNCVCVKFHFCIMATIIAMQLSIYQLPHLALGCETFVLCQSVPVCTLLLGDVCWQLQAGPVLNATKCQISTCCAGCYGSKQRYWRDNARHTHPLLLSLCGMSLLVHASSLNQSSRSSASSSFDAPENSNTVCMQEAAVIRCPANLAANVADFLACGYRVRRFIHFQIG